MKRLWVLKGVGLITFFIGSTSAFSQINQYPVNQSYQGANGQFYAPSGYSSASQPNSINRSCPSGNCPYNGNATSSQPNASNNRPTSNVSQSCSSGSCPASNASQNHPVSPTNGNSTTSNNNSTTNSSSTTNNSSTTNTSNGKPANGNSCPGATNCPSCPTNSCPNENESACRDCNYYRNAPAFQHESPYPWAADPYPDM